MEEVIGQSPHFLRIVSALETKKGLTVYPGVRFGLSLPSSVSRLARRTPWALGHGLVALSQGISGQQKVGGTVTPGYA